jgi:hypothetical protein
MDKCQALRDRTPKDLHIREKIAQNLPIYKKAIKNLLDRRAKIDFTPLDKLRSPNPKKENTLAFNSTMNEYSEVVLGWGRGAPQAESTRNVSNAHNDSGFASINKVFDSVKTDTQSRLSEKQFMNDMKVNELVNNAALVEEKLRELQSKFAALADSN